MDQTKKLETYQIMCVRAAYPEGNWTAEHFHWSVKRETPEGKVFAAPVVPIVNGYPELLIEPSQEYSDIELAENFFDMTEPEQVKEITTALLNEKY